MDPSTFLQVAALFVASAIAGAMNSVAGGGTLLTFPTLIWLGLDAKLANGTSTVGLVPGSFSGAWAYRRETHAVREWIAWLILPSLLGGITGALLLLRTPPALFDRLVPLLILGATVLFMIQEPVSRRLGLSKEGHPAGVAEKWIVALAQFGIATYGGYFGAGIGILMLASLSLLNLGDIHRTNGLKTFAATCINGVAALTFIAKGIVHWQHAAVMIVASVLGGYFGADYARRLGQRTIRRIVILIGLGAAASLAAREWL
jgi:uncharacterized protein